MSTSKFIGDWKYDTDGDQLPDYATVAELGDYFKIHLNSSIPFRSYLVLHYKRTHDLREDNPIPIFYELDNEDANKPNIAFNIVSFDAGGTFFLRYMVNVKGSDKLETRAVQLAGNYPNEGMNLDEIINKIRAIEAAPETSQKNTVWRCKK